ncbi:MAG: ATP-binding protein [Burkholderiales bacterium]
MTTNEIPQAFAEPATLLFVDDEANILSALKRLFQPLGYHILTAESGAAGLLLCEQNHIDLVISDMRMPEMNGIQFLEQVKLKWPDAVRILLTGYADVSSTIAAINQGEIYRYLAKPWEDNDIVLAVKLALECKHKALSSPEPAEQVEQQVNRQMDALAEANVRMVLYHSILENLRASGNADPETNDTVYNNIVSAAVSLTGAKYGAIGLFDANGNLTRFLTEGISEEERNKIGPYPSGKGLLRAFYQEGQVARIEHIAADPRSCGFPPGHPPMDSLLGIPLRVNGLTKGVIYLTNKHSGGTFSENDQMIVEMLAREVEHILERHDLLSSLRESNRTLLQEKEEQRGLIAKLEEARNQLLQSEKMASIGQLAAGVAHEINNPVGYVYSNLGSLDKYIQDILKVVAAYEKSENSIADSESLALIQMVKRESDLEFLREDIAALMRESREGLTRVKKIVQDLKDFSHVDEAEWQWADLHQGLDSTLNVVWNEIKYNAEVVKEYGDLPDVECLPSQLNQVFMNMLVNASHAIGPSDGMAGKERGTITLRSGQEGNQVWIEFADTGKGIAPENLGRIFDPFFTTKPVGKGTGLGLSLSYGIIQKHHGRIDVVSEVGKGTAFRIYLPIQQPEERA